MKNQTNQSRAPRILFSVGLKKDQQYLVEHLSMLVGAGMGIVDALHAIERGVQTKKMASIVRWMREEIQAGADVSDTMEQVQLFSDQTISLVRIGEQAGKLPENLEVVGSQQEKERQFRSKIRSAMLYPIFVLALTLTVGVAIAWFVLPKLAIVFSQLNLDLPLLTELLIDFGVFLSIYGSIAVPIFFIVAILGIFFIFAYPKTRFIGQTILFYVPGVSRLIQEVEVARFSYLLSTLLSSGLPLVDALMSIEHSTPFRRYKTFYTSLREEIELGGTFEHVFGAYKRADGLIPAPIQQLIVVGEQSGSLAVSLRKTHQVYDEKIDNTSKNLTVILEPVLLVIVWLGVVAVALAVILPIYNLVGQFNV